MLGVLGAAGMLQGAGPVGYCAKVLKERLRYWALRYLECYKGVASTRCFGFWAFLFPDGNVSPFQLCPK